MGIFPFYIIILRSDIISTRKQKQEEYIEKFGNIPINQQERLEWMIDKYKLSNSKQLQIIDKRNSMLCSLFYNDIDLVLYQIPEGTPRPRFRLVHRTNFVDCAITNPYFVHVYNLYAKEDNIHMQRMVADEVKCLEQLICTPINAVFNTFLETPKAYTVEDKFLSEIGLIRPIVKPDFDNLGKKYSDMSNHNLWLDDKMVMSGTINKYYSILPRIEINIRFLNLMYNKYQYNNMIRSKDFNNFNCNLDYFKYGGMLNGRNIEYK